MRRRAALVIVAAVATVIGMAAVAGRARAAGEDIKPCEPPCDVGAICLSGVCMMPAPPATAAPDAAYPEQTDPYPPPPPHGYRPPTHPPPLTTPRTPRSSGFQPVLYAGTHSFSGDRTNATEPGLRLGAILGGRATEVVSANGELTIDILNFDPDASGTMVQMTLSPLFHAATASADIVIGPRLGAWALTSHASAGGVSTNIEEEGWTLGANAGVFFPVGRGSTALGVLFSVATLQVTRACRSISGSGELCSGDVDRDFNLFSLTFAAML
jgi:hypothetical protein